ncbi:DUF4276 family protein [Dickeya oryzae]|uniref:DUF4276 family protein n=1 Tax=Dickeya oryzae TaxID=1240404 RepID=UPI001AECDCEC|nr:DUF4276 family protein [Dickeya oryzae]MBP2845920.1 DUF4276 family protein [Dickeya oryzae]
MSNYAEVIAIVEGKTEQVFIASVLAPYLAERNVYLHATQVSKPGQKGGDVRFDRTLADIGLHLKQRPNTYITTMVDYYGLTSWPGREHLPTVATPAQIANVLNRAAYDSVVEKFAPQQAERRFIPFMVMHEFEALLFSDSEILASELGIQQSEVNRVIEQCGGPEGINNSPHTAPSKRLDGWSAHGKFAKTTVGIALASRIGIPRIREQCPLFDRWLSQMEALAST